MKKGKSILAAIFIGMLMAVAAGAQDFSADLLFEQKKGRQSSQRMYYAQDRWRIEIPKELVSTIIVREDKELVWLLIPSVQKYLQLPIDNKYLSKYLKVTGKVNAEREYLGPDNVEGRAAEMYRVTYYDHSKVWVYYEWTDSNLQVPVKIQDGDSIMLYRNIKEGQLNRSLFEVPRGYKKISLPGMKEKSVKKPRGTIR